MSYTKGNWNVGAIFPLPTVYVNEKRVASISRELPIDEREANGKLIAAAPELLEACMNLENDDNSIPEHAWKLIQDAIKKATS